MTATIAEIDLMKLYSWLANRSYTNVATTGQYEYARYITKGESTVIIYKPSKKLRGVCRILNCPEGCQYVNYEEAETPEEKPTTEGFSQEAFDLAVAQMKKALKNHPNPNLTEVGFYMQNQDIGLSFTTTGKQYAVEKNLYKKNFMGQMIKDLED